MQARDLHSFCIFCCMIYISQKLSILFILLIVSISVQTVLAQTVAVLEIIPSGDVNLKTSEYRHLTDELRTRAREALPRDLKILTRDNIFSLMPSDSEEAECLAESCAIDIGRAIGAEYVTQGIVGEFDGMLTLTVELYESISGNLLGSFVTESNGLRGLLSAIRDKAPGLFANIAKNPSRPTKKNDYSKDSPTDIPTERRFGVRANAGMAMATILTSNNETIGLIGNIGNNIGLGAYALIPILGVYLVPEITIQSRKLIIAENTDFSAIGGNRDLTLEETAIDIPVFFRFRYREENIVYLGIGPYLGIILDAQGSFEEDSGFSRNGLDIGFCFELGFRIGKHFSLDIRGLGGLGSFDNATSSMMIQSQYGLSYTF